MKIEELLKGCQEKAKALGQGQTLRHRFQALE